VRKNHHSWRLEMQSSALVTKSTARRSIEKIAVWAILIGTPLLCSVLTALCLMVPITLKPGTKFYKWIDLMQTSAKNLLKQCISMLYSKRENTSNSKALEKKENKVRKSPFKRCKENKEFLKFFD
jgi:hypothetical protein